MKIPDNALRFINVLHTSLLKLKSNFFRKYGKIATCLALVVLSGSGFLLPQKTKAVTYTPQQIQLHLDTYTQGQGGFVKDNLIRVGKETGSAQIQAEITLLAPSSLTFGTDTFDMNTADDGANGTKVGGVTITGLGAGLDTMGAGTGAGGTDCSRDTVWVFSLKSNFEYLTCSFKESEPINFGTLTANTPKKLNLTVNFSDYNLNRSNTTSSQRIIVYPYATFDRALVGRTMAFPTGGFPVYIRFYNSQAEATAAITNNQRPSDVPTYGGGTTSAGQANPTGSALLGFVNEIIGIVLGFLQEIIYFIFYWLIAPLIQAMLSIRTYTDYFAGVIYPGWEVVRNLSNIVFIVALIAIGLATLFRIESYQYKHLLVQLVIAALLVNFSLVIAQAILGVADTVQSQFLPNNVEVIRSLAKDLMVSYRSTVWNLNITQQGYFSSTIQPLFFLALSLGSFAVFCAIAIYLVIRIVALWILLLVSPIAYIARVLPATHHFSEEWWSKFIKYAFFTPIMAFFLNMAAVMANTYKENPVLKQIVSDPQSLGLDNSFSAFVFKVASNILLLVFLIAALKVAEEAGVYGASAINKMAEKGIYAPFAITGKSASALSGKFGQWYAKKTALGVRNATKEGKNVKAAFLRGAMLLNPKIAKKSWEERAHDKELEAYSEAFGAGRDTLNRIMPTEWQWGKMMKGQFKEGLGQRTYYGRIGHANMVAHKRSEWEKATLSAEEKAEALRGAHHADEVEALSYLMCEGRHEDDYTIPENAKEEVVKKMKDDMYNQKLLQLKDEGVTGPEAEEKARKFSENAQGYFDKVQWGETLYKKFRHGGASHEDAIERLRHLQEYYEGEQKTRGIGIVVKDNDGMFRLNTDLKYYDQIGEKAKQSGKAEDNKAFLKELYKLGVFKSDQVDENGNLRDDVSEIKFEMLDKRTGKTIDTKTIKNYDDYKKAVEDTAARFNNFYDHAWKRADMGYAIAGARGWRMDARTRHRRGNAERWAMDFEPAQNKIQTEKMGYIGQNSFGERAEAEKPDTHMTALGKSRGAQSRGPEDIGIIISPEGKHSFQLYDFALAVRTNVKLVKTLIEQAKLTHAEIRDIVRDIKKDPEHSEVAIVRDEETGNLRGLEEKDLMSPSKPS